VIALNAGLDRPRDFSTCRAACDFGYSHSPAARYKGFSLRRLQKPPTPEKQFGQKGLGVWSEAGGIEHQRET
jgi:hypothetical protein